MSTAFDFATDFAIELHVRGIDATNPEHGARLAAVFELFFREMAEASEGLAAASHPEPSRADLIQAAQRWLAEHGREQLTWNDVFALLCDEDAARGFAIIAKAHRENHGR